jgi:hypothetical protein
VPQISAPDTRPGARQAGASRPFPLARKAFLTAQNLADLGHFVPEVVPP